MVPICLMWLEWKERNARTFEDIERSIDLLKTLLARLCGLVFRILRFVFPCPNFVSLLDFPFDLIIFVSSAVSLQL